MIELPTTIDLEASGFGRGSYPIEVGIALPDGTCHCMLIQPADEWNHWDEEAERTHRISRYLLQQRGLPPREVATRLNALLGTQTVYSDAWGHDTSWLGKLYDVANVRQTFVLETARQLLSENQLLHWNRARETIMAQQSGTRHRASSDARALQLTITLCRTWEAAGLSVTER